MGTSKEHILCAAIWYNDGVWNHTHGVKNRITGFVLCGPRHCFINALLVRMGFDRLKFEEVEQGFLTSANRFANRKQAAAIAYKAGQITMEKWKGLPGGQLTSEDLY